MNSIRSRSDSVRDFVTGRAQFIDDIPLPAGAFHVALGLSEWAHATITSMDLSPVRQAPGVVCVLTAEDVPGNNRCSQLGDDPIFAEQIVEYNGQCLFAVIARSHAAAEHAAQLAVITATPLLSAISIDEATLQQNRLVDPLTVQRGDMSVHTKHQVQGSIHLGGQEHFYMEGQIAAALPEANGEMRIVASTQHPAEVQLLVAAMLGCDATDVIVQCPRLGGGFGGKETQATQIACIAGLAASITGNACKLRLSRHDDMVLTGKRHDMRAHYVVGFDRDGLVSTLRVDLHVRCGFSADLSVAVCTRALLHLDNAYYLPNISFTAHLWRTNTSSATAFRGFGAPQALLVVESALLHVARELQIDSVELRARNFYRSAPADQTPYGMTVTDNILQRITTELLHSSAYTERRRAIALMNAAQPAIKRGIAFCPVKFGISFTQTHLNQAGALVNIYTDGSIQVAHGGTEMGQGLNEKIAAIAARAFGVSSQRFRVAAADTSRVPNASPTAASVSSDLIGRAVENAIVKLRERLIRVAALHHEMPEELCTIEDDCLVAGNLHVPFDQLVRRAYEARVSLSATGYYTTPEIHFDNKAMQGQPFYYFVYGAAVSEVAVDVLTGESRVLRVDILQDVGHSLVPDIDRGQIEGGFMQGLGWLTTESVVWSETGRLLTDGPDTYKIPTSSDMPPTFNVQLAGWSTNKRDTVFLSKGIGEPPLLLAVSVHLAIREAIAAVNPAGALSLSAPASPEAVLHALSP